MISIAVTDRRQCRKGFLDQIESICSAGIDLLVLREKDLSKEEYTDLAMAVKGICSRYNVEFCINTFTDIARDLRVKTVWVPYGDFKKDKKADRNIVSVHSMEEAVDAESEGADMLVFGNVFETTCKPGKAAAGTDVLKRICGAVDIPVAGIGGISTDNLKEVADAGAVGACIMSGFMLSDDPSAIVKAFKAV